MRGETRLGAVLKFWVLQPRFWAAPLACWLLAMCLSGGLWPDHVLPTLLAAALVALGFYFAASAVLAISAAPRPQLVPGWTRVHRCASLTLGLLVVAALSLAFGGADGMPLHLASSFVCFAATTGVFSAFDSQAPAGRTRMATFIAALISAGVLTAFIALEWSKIEPVPAVDAAAKWVRIIVPAFFAGRLPVVSWSVAAALLLAAMMPLLRLEQGSRRNFAGRSAPATPTLRRVPLPAVASPVRPIEPEKERRGVWISDHPGWLNIRRPPRTAIGRGLLFVESARVKRLLLIWLGFCPLCLWLQLLPLRSSGLLEPRDFRITGSVAIVIASIASFAPAGRLLGLLTTPASIPRAVLFPCTRAQALRRRFALIVASSFPMVLLVVSFFGHPGLRETATTADLLWPLAGCTLAVAVIFSWIPGAQYARLFHGPGGGGGWPFAMVIGFFAVPIAALLIASLFPVFTHPTADDRVLAVFCFSTSVLVGTTATLAALHFSRRWDLRTR